jgi:hypothetical protein
MQPGGVYQLINLLGTFEYATISDAISDTIAHRVLVAIEAFLELCMIAAYSRAIASGEW